MKGTLVFITALLTGVYAPVSAQRIITAADTVAIGGIAGEEVYLEEAEGGSPTIELEHGVWDYADSVFHFPGHAEYRKWDTERIFPGHDYPTSPVVLTLAYEDCDHAYPILGAVNSRYGMRRGRFHHGVDIDLERGSPIASAFSGKVRISRYSSSFGNVVVVRHHNGLETLYAHLSSRDVKVGDEVEAGEVIGKGGSTGRSSGDHLHLEVRYLGRSIDPAQVFHLTEGTLASNELQIGARYNSPERRADAQSRSYHLVRKGDTLYSLARANGTSVDQLCRLNGISNSATLRVGKRLRLR